MRQWPPAALALLHPSHPTLPFALLLYLRQAADAEEEKRRVKAEAGTLCQQLLSLADHSLPKLPLAEFIPAQPDTAPPDTAPPGTPPDTASLFTSLATPGAGKGGLAFDLKGVRKKAAAGEEGEVKRVKLSVAPDGPAGEALLPNWFTASDETGGVYFFNSCTDEATWDMPLLWPSAPVLPPRETLAESG